MCRRKFSSSDSSVFPAISLGFIIFCKIFCVYDIFLKSNHRGSHNTHIPSSEYVGVSDSVSVYAFVFIHVHVHHVSIIHVSCLPSSSTTFTCIISFLH